MNADGTNQHLVLSDPSYGDYAANFAPDDSDVIFTRCQQIVNGTCAIYRVQADGTGLAAITQFAFPLVDFEPAYSPDGRRIAFQSFDRGGILGAIYQMDADGSNIRRLTPPAPGAVSANWSPDGEKVAFSTHCCNPQNNEIWAINADGRRLAQVTDANGGTMDDLYPSWSPQGDAIAFERFDPSSGTSAIFVMNADGGELRKVLELPRSEPKRVELRMGERNRMKRALKQIEQGGAYPQWGPASQP
jgi:Tol biopolymer transport system component